MWAEGLRGYIVDWSNILDMIVLSMYLASFSLRVLIMAIGHFVCQDQNLVEKCAYFTQTGELYIPTRHRYCILYLIPDQTTQYPVTVYDHLKYTFGFNPTDLYESSCMAISCLIAVRDEWWQEDPQLISEILFAVTSMLSFTRLAYILPAHESLGTLQISIGIMIDDMMR